MARAPAAVAPRGRMAALVLGALTPDVDLLIAPFGWDRYLVVHEVAAHSLVWSPVLALAVARVAGWFAKVARRRDLWLPAWLGIVVGHLLFDLISGSDMRLFAPLSPARWGPHWLAMADPLVIAVLLTGTIAGFWRRQLAARVTLIALLALTGAKAFSQQRAAETFGKVNGTVASHPEAIGGSFQRWTFFDRNGDDVRAWRVDAWSGTTTLLFERRDASSDALVRSTTAATVVRRLLDLAHLPFARLETSADGHRLVLWSDIRYCRDDRCDLSFGVEVDDAGRLLRQVARIGPVSQWRALR